RDFHVTGVQTCALPISLGNAALLCGLCVGADQRLVPARKPNATQNHDSGLRVLAIFYRPVAALVCFESRPAQASYYPDGGHRSRSEERRVGKELICRGA